MSHGRNTAAPQGSATRGAFATRSASRPAVAGVHGILHRLSGAELAELMSLVDDVKSQAAAQVVIASEAAHRCEFTSARRGEGSAHEWVRKHARMADRLNPRAVGTVTKAILDHGFEWGARDAKRIRTRLLAEHGLDGELEDKQRRLRTGAHLSQPQVSDGDITGRSGFGVVTGSTVAGTLLNPGDVRPRHRR